MRLSIDLPDDLHRDLKAKAATEGKTISEVVRSMVEGYLAMERFVYPKVDKEAARRVQSANALDGLRLSKSDQAKGRTRK